MDLIYYLELKKSSEKITTYELAKEIGISPTMLYWVLNGKRKAGVKTMRNIAKYYNLDIEKVVQMNDNIKQV